MGEWLMRQKKKPGIASEFFGFILCHANSFPCFEFGQWAGIGIRLDGTVMHDIL